MQFFIFVLIICFVIFLFSLYTFSHDDFVLLRRNISTDDMFNFAFEVSILSLIFSRIFYVIFHPKPVLLNPLGFILFPYFPGLSMLGGVIGALIFFAILLRKDKFPIGRVFDFFSMSFLSAIPVGVLGYILLSKDHSLPTVLELILYAIFFVVIVFFIMQRMVKSGKQDGVIGLTFLFLFSLVTLIHEFLNKTPQNLKIVEYLILIVLLFSCASLLLRQVIKTKILKK